MSVSRVYWQMLIVYEEIRVNMVKIMHQDLNKMLPLYFVLLAQSKNVALQLLL